MIRIIPDMTRAKAHWTHRSSEVPDFIMVPMSDGTVVRFVPEIPQPGFVKAMENVRNMVVGYEKPADAATSNRPAKKGLRGQYTTEKEN